MSENLDLYSVLPKRIPNIPDMLMNHGTFAMSVKMQNIFQMSFYNNGRICYNMKHTLHKNGRNKQNDKTDNTYFIPDFLFPIEYSRISD